VSDALRWAVTDGPSGTTALLLPEDRAGARRVAEHAGGAFWCSREAGGCGGRLAVDAGTGPRFRHPAGARCALADGGPPADRGYEHLRYQPVLAAWLAGQGHRPRLERIRGTGGGTDLRFAVEDAAAVLVVQLSPLPDTAWRQRDDALRARSRHVTWLFGPAAEAGAATEVAVRGVALSLRRHGGGLAVGVRDVEGGTRWVPLSACRLTGDGLSVPGVDEARARHACRTADREEAARHAAQRETRRRPPRATPWTAALPPLPFPG
jgi:hypothetical protein